MLTIYLFCRKFQHMHSIGQKWLGKTPFPDNIFSSATLHGAAAGGLYSGRSAPEASEAAPRWQGFKGTTGLLKIANREEPESCSARFSELAQNNPGLDETLILVN